jgi:hypothetical protein
MLAFRGGKGVSVGSGAEAALVLLVLVEAGFGACAKSTQPPRKPPKLILAIHKRKIFFMRRISLPLWD